MKSKTKKVVKITGIGAILAACTTISILCCTVFDRPLRTFVGETAVSYTNDYVYNSTDLTAKTLQTVKEDFAMDVAREGIALLQYDKNYMPYKQGETFSIFGQSSVNIAGGGNLKTAFTDAGFSINETLWNFYSSGNGSSYKRGTGSIDFGDDMDYSINECPLDVLQAETGLEATFTGTTAVFVLSRICGEGVDPARAMYGETDIVEDQSKNYQEPDSVELKIIDYLNQNFDDVLLIVNSSNSVELGWTKNYEHIHNVLSMANPAQGIYALGEILSGETTPSAKTVDTWAFDALSSPAAQNAGDFAYYYNNELTTYNYLTYAEGIYVGYKYYETRYEDKVLGRGNAGDYDYSSVVQYPFGYGLSFTEFQWSDFAITYDSETKSFQATVTVKNVGDYKGKDVLELYAQKPYTTYDVENKVEKSAVDLVGFTKTSELEPGASETVSITFDREQLKSFDSNNKETYILENGEYYFTMATDSHNAINNILAEKGYTSENSSMDEDGNTAFCEKYEFTDLSFDEEGVDSTTYAKDTKTNTSITNQLSCGERGDITYLTRNDWVNTFPSADGEISDVISNWGNAINGVDSSNNPVGYAWRKDLSDEDYAQIQKTGKEASLNPNLDETHEAMTTSASNDVQLIDLRGKDYSDSSWEELLDNLTVSDYVNLVALSGYGGATLSSIGKPATNDRDAATGLVVTKALVSLPNIVVLAQTFNRELSHEYGNLIGQDGLLGGSNGNKVTGWYAPAMNIHRTPFTGRAGEYYSEDPFLSGVFASESATGAAEYGMYTFIKHFAINEQELHRGDRGQGGLVTWFNEQSARELYLVPFETCIKADPVTQYYYEMDENGKLQKIEYSVPAANAVMTSFNRLGFTWAGGNYDLITDILRKEWGFNGFVLTDYDNGGYMDTEQMIYAGGDGKLNTLNTCNWSLDTTDNEDCYYARQAAHHILYTVANSATVNGLYHGVAVASGFPYYAFIVIGIDAVGAIGVLLLALSIWKQRKKETPEAN